MNVVYRVNCEWDVGQYQNVFNSIGTAERWINDNPSIMEALEVNGIESPMDLIEHGLLSIEEVNLVHSWDV